MKKTSFWVILICAIAALSALALVWQHHQAKADAVIANIYQDGELIRTIDLNKLTEPETFTVTGPAGENEIVAEPGRICVSHADCPDQVCVNMGWRSEDGFPIVCLPNKLVIEIESSADANPIDGVVG